jgi:uncharacterized ion transporter superfamily protein YfcC
MRSLLRRFTVPHVFIFLSAIILFCAILTYVVPAGAYTRTTRTVGQMEQTIVVPGSYERLSKHYSLKGILLGEQVEGKASPTSFLGLFTSIPKGLNQSAALIFFVFTIGAVFNLIRQTGTVHIVIYGLMRRFRKAPSMLLFSIYFAIAILSSFLGMGQEFMPLIPLFMIISKANGYDRIFGLALFAIPFSLGWTSAITNPFTVQIAQKIAELPIGSGMGLRMITFLVLNALGFIYLMRYGKKVKRNRALSAMPDDPFILPDDEHKENLKLERKHVLIILTATLLFALILYAVQTMGWGLLEMTGGFFLVGVATILISGMSGDESMKAFVRGLEIMIIPALVIGFARGIQVVIVEGQILDTMLNSTSLALKKLPGFLAAEGMFLFQTFLNFFIPSASGQALVSMPLMTPLADLLGVSRQTAVLAYALGDGLSNTIIPTSGFLMAILGLAGIPFENWVRFMLPLFILLSLAAFVIIGLAVFTGYGS